MKTKYKNLNEQVNRMKSLFTEERLYGNLVEQDSEEAQSGANGPTGQQVKLSKLGDPNKEHYEKWPSGESLKDWWDLDVSSSEKEAIESVNGIFSTSDGDDDEPMVIKTFVNGVVDGPVWKFEDVDGKVLKTISVEKGELDSDGSTSRVSDPEGYMSVYDNGKLSGVFTIDKWGNKEGPMIQYWPDGSIKMVGDYNYSEVSTDPAPIYWKEGEKKNIQIDATPLTDVGVTTNLKQDVEVVANAITDIENNEEKGDQKTTETVGIPDMSRMNCKRLLSKLYKDYKKLGVSGDYAGFMAVENLKEKSGGDGQVIKKLQVCYRQFKEKDFLNKKTIAGSFKETFEKVHGLGNKTQFEKDPGDKKVKLKNWYEIDPTLKIKWKMNNIFVVDGKGTFIAAKNPDEMQPGKEKTYNEYVFGSPEIPKLIKQILTGAKQGSQGSLYKIGNNGKTIPYASISGIVITKLGNKGKSVEMKVIGKPKKTTDTEEIQQ